MLSAEHVREKLPRVLEMIKIIEKLPKTEKMAQYLQKNLFKLDVDSVSTQLSEVIPYYTGTLRRFVALYAFLLYGFELH